MLKKKIKLQVHYTPLYMQKFLKKFNFSKKDYPVTEDFYRREVSIPIFYDLKKKMQDSIVSKLLSVINRYAK